MHILTKVFVVMAAVLSLMLAAATMIYANNAEAVRQAYIDADLARNLSDRALTVQASAHARDTANLMGEIESREQQLADLRKDMESLKTENDRLRRAAEDAVIAKERIEGQIGQLGVASRTQAALIASYKDEVSKLRDAELRFRDERLQLEDTVADQASQIEVLLQESRALQEQLAALRSDLESAKAGGNALSPTSAGVTTPVSLSGPPIFGFVKAVRTEPGTGKTLVQVDLGANDRMRENVKLLVFRGDTFIANLVLKRVDLQDSIAEILLSAPGAEIRPGDRVTTRLTP
ncbi:MAG TPA: hypothetical protein ENK11_08050 [Phycisphaerales bacterium]|nr:hypothetical protein [Phycisphaerales bacterium]